MVIGVDEIQGQIKQLLDASDMINKRVVQLAMIIVLGILGIAAMMLDGEIGKIIAVACAAAIGVIVTRLFRSGKGDQGSTEDIEGVE